MIGIFGATISIIHVIRNVGSQKVDEHIKLGDDKIEEMKNKSAASSIVGEAEDYRDSIKQCGAWFTRCTLVAAVIFGVWIFTTAFFVSFKGGCNKLFQLGSVDTTNTTDPCHPVTTPKRSDEDASPNQGVIEKGFTTIVFSDWTIGLVSFAYLTLLFVACYHFKKADKNYDEIFKIHKRFIKQREADTGDLKKTGGKTIKDKPPSPPESP
jgi:hypothetical protein